MRAASTNSSGIATNIWRNSNVAVAEAMSGKLLIDGRNALDPAAVRAAGLVYEGIGRR